MQKQEFYKSFKISSNVLDEILCKELSIPKEELFLLDEIDDNHIKNIKKTIKKFQKGTPLEYILKKANFYSLDFFVDKRVLIPRNDTEVMVKEALKELKTKSGKLKENVVFIDVGTGSGNIAISCLLNSPNIKNCFVIDKSKKALEVNKINIEKYGLQDKIVQLKGGLLKPIFQLIKTQKGQKIYKSRNLNNNSFLSGFSGLCGEIVITANLPYIKNGDYKNMLSETLKCEPKVALFGGKGTGFELYEKLIKEVMKLNIYKSRNLINGNYLDFKVKTLFIEIGFDQYKYSRRYLENLGLKYEYFKDNSGIWRCAKIYF